jgi:hypothetical protein
VVDNDFEPRYCQTEGYELVLAASLQNRLY